MNENDEKKIMEERERAEISFDILEREYEDLLEEIKINPDLEKIKAMRQRIEASESEMKNINIIDVYEEKLSAMKGNLLKHLKPLHRPPEVDQGEGVEVEGVEVEPEAFGDETGVIVAPEASIVPAPMKEGGQPILKKVENPGLKYVNEAIEAAETGLLDDAGQPRKDSFGNFLDTREQFPKDFVRGINYTVGGKSSRNLKEKEEAKKEEVKKIVKDFLGIVENEPENSEKSKQYQFIINAGQDLISMFTDDVKHNIQYQGADLGPVGTPPFEMKWSMEGEEVILEIQCNVRILGLRGEPPENLIALNQSGEVELFELGEAPADSPPLVKYNYKARLVPTENGAKLETKSYSVELHPGLSHNSQKFTFSAANAFTEMQNAINSFNNEYTGSESARTLSDQIQRMKDAIKAVKDSAYYKFVKDSNGGTKEEKKAISMIDRLDKILQASERSKMPILASIVQKAVLSQVNRMKNSDEFNTGIVRLAKKTAKPGQSYESKEESMDTIKLGKEDLRMMKEFIERVDRLQKDIRGTAAVELDNKEVYESFKRDFNALKKTQKEVGGDVIIDRGHWNGMLQRLNTVSDELAKVHVYEQGCFQMLSNDGARFSLIETGKNNLRKQIDLIKITPEYLEYQQQKREGKEKENPQHEMFTALDKCEKLLVKAISTQKFPLVSRANDNKLQKFFEENATKFQPKNSPTSRVSVSNK